MAYVGRGLNQDGGQYRKLDSIASSFDGSEVNFNLTIDGLEVTPTAQNLMISLGGVIQEPGSAFSVSGGTITFASVTLVPTREGRKTGAGSAVRVRRALRAVGRAPEVVRAAARGKRFEG